MSRRCRFQLCRALAVILVSGAGSLACAATRPLNILHLHADDHRADAVGALGNPVVQTPHLDALIARLFADSNAAYLHAHYARQGCFAARIDRA